LPLVNWLEMIHGHEILIGFLFLLHYPRRRFLYLRMFSQVSKDQKSTSRYTFRSGLFHDSATELDHKRLLCLDMSSRLESWFRISKIGFHPGRWNTTLSGQVLPSPL